MKVDEMKIGEKEWKGLTKDELFEVLTGLLGERIPGLKKLHKHVQIQLIKVLMSHKV